VLWDGYARLERQRDNIQSARTVYVTALQAARARTQVAASVTNEDEAELWASWAEMEWEAGNAARCLAVLALPWQDDIGSLGKTDCQF
jgi:hypothetical protein